VFSNEPIILTPVGYVRTAAAGDEVKDKSRTSEIIINPELAPALLGIEEYSHLHILFWLHEVTEEKRVLQVHPRGRTDLPLTGAFAARTNLRPNPIGLTIVELLSVKGNVLQVRGLDAYNSTPVLDVKPYDFWDVKEGIRVPKWWSLLHGEKPPVSPQYTHG
jgi:tRNA (adenine37-N6)-methyltransferase